MTTDFFPSSISIKSTPTTVHTLNFSLTFQFQLHVGKSSVLPADFSHLSDVLSYMYKSQKTVLINKHLNSITLKLLGLC
jgi:hypothetical protein